MLRNHKPVLLGSAAALLCVLGAVTTLPPGIASAAPRPAVRDAKPGASLLLNAGAQAGARCPLVMRRTRSP